MVQDKCSISVSHFFRLFVSFYGRDAPYFIFIYLSIGRLGCFHFEALRDNATGNSGIDVFCINTMFLFSPTFIKCEHTLFGCLCMVGQRTTCRICLADDCQALGWASLPPEPFWWPLVGYRVSLCSQAACSSWHPSYVQLPSAGVTSVRYAGFCFQFRVDT